MLKSGNNRTMTYKRYNWIKFRAWKNKVYNRLPDLVIKLYTFEKKGNYIDYDKKKLLGSVIREISNPEYAHMDNGKFLDDTNQMAYQIILELEVQRLFKFINSIRDKH